MLREFLCKLSRICRLSRKRVPFTIDQSIVRVGKQYNILILPLDIDYEFTDLYPISNNVHTWNTFIVGRGKSYIQASIYDLAIDNHERMTDKNNILSDELNKFFDPIWDKTLNGCDVQFMMVWLNKTYVVNTYAIKNFNKTIIGAVMFIRNANDLLPLLQKSMHSKRTAFTT